MRRGSFVIAATVPRPNCCERRSKDVQANPAKPNIVFILADDMRKDDMRDMPKTRSLLGGKGMRFQNAFVSNPFAAPPEPPSCAASTLTTPACGSTVALTAAGKRVENMREFPRLMVAILGVLGVEVAHHWQYVS